jgi:hypothetical protein
MTVTPTPSRYARDAAASTAIAATSHTDQATHLRSHRDRARLCHRDLSKAGIASLATAPFGKRNQ